ncbi:TB2/DP1, HVA22 family domain-containing protein [Ditylenchus destructor]|uniref:Receptor expression-enhancing protein n=1 Tax=Ditylenchus destructor TaxID=166010 RepID=A0AAD4NGK7_9BILA|nr:TB2/DP1, HVA22 family domain-containing protein [Ditylenchus destructor]
MISVFFSRVVILTAGTLYPAYRSFKAVRTKDVREYVKWMMYWIIFALFCFGETLADILISFWFPFYYELKIVFVLWLLSPWTKGASILYRKWVHPMLMKHESEIDTFLEQAKAESYKQVVNLGSRGLMCARDIVATAALRGQAQLAEQLQRSYSAGDVNRGEIVSSTIKRSVRVTEIEEEEEDEMQVRTWTGAYDNDGRIIEQSLTRIDQEDVIIIEDPTTTRRQRSRSRTGTSDLASEQGSSSSSNTLPRRSSRRAGGGS